MRELLRENRTDWWIHVLHAIAGGTATPKASHRQLQQRERRERVWDTARGAHEFQEDIRFEEGRKKFIRTVSSSWFPAHCDKNPWQHFTSLCNSNPIIVFLQIQYVSRSLVVSCNWLLQVRSTSLISSFRNLNAEQRLYSLPLLAVDKAGVVY